MPTPKKDAVKWIAESLKDRADAVEAIIERKIAEGNSRIALGAGQLPKDASLVVLKVVADRYEKAGWDVQVADDQRDGLYIVVS